MLKFLFVATLAVVAAEPEADPSLGISTIGLSPLGINNGLLLNGGLGLGLLNRGIIGSPLIANPWPIKTAVIGSKIWKREAEAEPEADPSLGISTLGLGPLGLNNGLLLNRGLGLGLINRGIIGSPLIANPWPVKTAVIGSRIWKRDAEPEPEADPSLGYSTLGLSPLGLNNGLLLNRGLGLGLLNRGIIGSPLIANPWPVKTAVIGSRIWKRDAEAEPEADPSLGVSTLGLGPLGLNNGLLLNGGLGLGLLNRGIIGSPLIANPWPVKTAVIGSRIWKRDAEPEPEADPSLGYSTLGLSPLGIRSGLILNRGLGLGLLNRGIIGSPLIAKSGLRLWKREAEAEAEPIFGLLRRGLRRKGYRLGLRRRTYG